MNELQEFISRQFGVDEQTFLYALSDNPSAQGYILGAISEFFLRSHLEHKGFEVVRIIEKPAGGFHAKSSEARGDFYFRKKGSTQDAWLVIESKGLKSNSEFRGSRLDSPEKVYRFLKAKVFNPARNKDSIYQRGYRTFLRQKQNWFAQNPGKQFPDFKWSKEFPGPESFVLNNLWKNEQQMSDWVYSFKKYHFTEQAYRNIEGPIAILETHAPNPRTAAYTKIKQAGPLVSDFNIMCVDLFLRTRKHELVFMSSNEISHSPTSPEHQYQNYIIDILVRNLKTSPVIQRPWYMDIQDCIDKTKPAYRKIDMSQVDERCIDTSVLNM